MTQNEKDSVKKKIEEEILLTQEQISALKEKVKPIAPDCSLGRLTRLEAMGEQHMNNKILEESKIKLTRLKNALLRVDKPIFGICIECEEEIGFGRMSIRPESVRCVECASKM
ncbi:MAG TPA: TraR/DksA family transcriptional regulator [Sulfurovum sp.]|nr:TraR/DksA family transcriptional regulator [Sulfurovum sp.]